MSLILITAPQAEPLALADIKLHLRLEAGYVDEDALLNGFITAARLVAEDFLRRALITQEWQYNLDEWPLARMQGGGWQWDYSEILLPNPPFQSMTSFKYLDANGVLQTFAGAGVDYILDVGGDTAPARVRPAYQQAWPVLQAVPNAVQLKFKAGYGDADANVPATILLAMKMLIAQWHENREAAAAAPQTELPFAVKALLEPYRNLVV